MIPPEQVQFHRYQTQALGQCECEIIQRKMPAAAAHFANQRISSSAIPFHEKSFSTAEFRLKKTHHVLNVMRGSGVKPNMPS
jgi:hypothetical protein